MRQPLINGAASLVALFVALIATTAVAAPAPPITPEPRLQEQIDVVSRTSIRDAPLEKYRQALVLRSLVGDQHADYQRLILNIAYFAKGGADGVQSGRKRECYHYLVRMLDLPRPLILGTLLPLLCS